MLVGESEPCFERMTSSPTPPFSREGRPVREKGRETRRHDQTDDEGERDESQHPLPDSSLYSLTDLHERKNKLIQKCEHVQTNRSKDTTRHTLIHPRMNTIHLSLYNLTFMMFGSSFDPLICAFLHCITGICRFKRTCISRHTARIVQSKRAAQNLFTFLFEGN